MGRAELAGRGQFPVVDVDGDDLRRPGQTRPGDGGAPDAPAADDGHGVTASHVRGVDGGADSRHHAAAQQSGGGRRRGPVDLGALPCRHQRLLRERPDAERRRQLLAGRGEGHLLPGVVRGEAVPGPPPQTGAALAAHRPPVEDDEVTGRHVGDVLPHGLHDARGLVPQQEREVVVDAALPVVQIGVADPAGLDPHQRLTRPGIGHDDRFQTDGGALALRDDSTDLVSHGHSSAGTGSMETDVAHYGTHLMCRNTASWSAVRGSRSRRPSLHDRAATRSSPRPPGRRVRTTVKKCP